MLPTKTSSVEAIAVVLRSPESRFVILLTVADMGTDEVICFVPASAAAKRCDLKRVAVAKR
jgi:hypothetical protein